MQQSQKPAERIYYESAEQTSNRRQSEMNLHSNIQLTVEQDFIDSFLAFANYLDNVNPICPPDSIDTVDKLLSLLAQK